MCTLQSIVQAVKEAGASFCYYKVNNSVICNEYDEDDEPDTPATVSISLYIRGGEDIDIARAIYNSRPLGVRLNGDFSLTVELCSISWYNLNYVDYAFSKEAERISNRILRREYLLKKLTELENEE